MKTLGQKIASLAYVKGFQAARHGKRFVVPHDIEDHVTWAAGFRAGKWPTSKRQRKPARGKPCTA